MTADYVVGIDLGTTNSVLAYASLASDAAGVEVLPIPQLVAPGTVESRSMLPSFLYRGTAAETQAADLPWTTDQQERDTVGQAARRRGAEAPQRTIAGAKSWLAHHGVDRRAPILPPNAGDDIEPISPLEASRRYLAHLIAA